MATKIFELNSEPYRAQVAGVNLEFVPEVVGAAFATAYAKLREAQKATDGAEEDPETLVMLDRAMKEFIRSFVTPEYRDAWEALELPTRLLVSVMQWVAELYGGGSDARPTGPSSASATRSKRTGTRG